MSERQLLDEVMTLFLAGHETTAMALTWAWYLLATHPDALAALQREVDTVLAGRAPTLADLPNLPYSDMVIKETMRLYPPAPGVSREAIEDVTLGGYPIKRGAMVAVSFYAMHRDERYFENPQAFIPERFDKAHEGQFPRYAYQPFGAGPRVCIGNSFAMLEARLALATMAQRYTMAVVEGQQIVPQQLVTIRPKNGIRMHLTQREIVLA
jgi:cytochrome P450